MPTNTTIFNIPKPLASDVFTNANFNTILDAIESGVSGKVQMTKLTGDAGGAKLSLYNTSDDLLASLVGLGVGIHTFYSAGVVTNVPAGKSVRGFAHITNGSPTIGYVVAIDFSNIMYINYVDSGVWTGWKALASTDKAQMTKITNDSGDLKIKVTSSTDDVLGSLVSAGVGLHTFYSTNNVINVPSTYSVRGIAHITSASPSAYGWAICVDSNNTMYMNYVNGGTWSGWKKVGVDQTTAWTPLTLQNSWVAFGGGFATPSYRLNANGEVQLRGVMKSGVATNGTILATLPSGYRPTSDRVYLVMSNNGTTDVIARVQISSSGNITIVSGANTLLSLDNIPTISTV